jgi:hypothetical protein
METPSMMIEPIARRNASAPVPAATCVHCTREMEPSHMFGDLRYYVCRPCNAWAIPFPPELPAVSSRAVNRCVSTPVGVPYVDEAR